MFRKAAPLARCMSGYRITRWRKCATLSGMTKESHGRFIVEPHRNCHNALRPGRLLVPAASHFNWLPDSSLRLNQNLPADGLIDRGLLYHVAGGRLNLHPFFHMAVDCRLANGHFGGRLNKNLLADCFVNRRMLDLAKGLNAPDHAVFPAYTRGLNLHLPVLRLINGLCFSVANPFRLHQNPSGLKSIDRRFFDNMAARRLHLNLLMNCLVDSWNRCLLITGERLASRQGRGC
jgi:hypothetical protein